MEMVTIDTELLGQLVQDAVARALEKRGGYPKDEALWDRKKTAAYLGIKEQTLGVMASQGRGPAPTKIGSRALYRPEIVRQYAKDNTLPR
jgi:hypothetical protein